MVLIETDVLIVGSGPAGGTAALALATYGIDHLLVTQWGRLVRTPRAHITNQRAMEILRDFGIEEEALQYATPQALMGNNVFCESLAGEELGRLYSWGNHPQRMADYTLASPTKICDIPQNFMEPVLIGNATQRGTTVLYNTKYISMVQDADGVTVTVEDRITKHTYQIRAKYLIGADGGNSQVAVDADLPFGGKMGVAGSMNIVFEADLSRYVAYRPSVLYWVLQPGADIGGIGMGLVRMVRPWNKWLIVWGYDINAGTPEMTDEMAIQIVHNLVGDQSIDVKIDSTSVWTVNHCYAEDNMRGRVFIVGDAAHRHPPSNGLGSNTSMQDSYNLAWKLAHVLRGHAAPSLLESYRDERLPIAKQVVDRANQSIDEFGPIFEALGLLSTTDPDQMKANMVKRKENTPEAAKQREALRQAIHFKSYEFNCHGVEMNQRYQSQAVVPDGTPMPAYARDAELYYQPTTWPGAHLPHTWLRREGHGDQIVSTLDLCGKGRFTLLTGIGGEAWVDAAKHITAQTGLEIAVYVIGPGRDYQDIYGEWPDLRQVEEAGCLLVRPDLYVGWRHSSAADNALDLLAGALGQLLGKPLPLAMAHA
ncbi:MAG: FAD-dependent oxidoreductase [Phototrophicaceae bacterium]